MLHLRITFLGLCIYLIEGRITMSGMHEKALRDELFRPGVYDKLMRPVLHPSHVLNVSFAVQLSKLSDLNTKSQLLVTDVWISQKWNNPFLAWNKSEYGGTHSIHVPPTDVWVPDTVLYNSGDSVTLSGTSEKFKTNVILDSSGACSWLSPATFKSSCQIDVTFFPFDTQTCQLTFGSWTYDNRLLVLSLLHKKHSNADKFTVSGDWEVKSVTVKRIDKNYACCQHSFSDITYTLVLERKPLYHVIYVVLPCVLIAILTLLCFYVPPGCGERIGLCITVLLAMSVYLLLVAESLPDNSNNIPLLGVYYMSTMFQVALAIVGTAVVLRCFHSQSKPPELLIRFGRFGQRNQGARVRDISKGRVSPDTNTEMTEVEVSTKAIRGRVVDEKQKEEDENEIRQQWQKEWLQIGKRFDMMFFILFLFIFLVTPLAIFLKKAPVEVVD